MDPCPFHIGIKFCPQYFIQNNHLVIKIPFTRPIVSECQLNKLLLFYRIFISEELLKFTFELLQIFVMFL